jgi:hypothetical protein
VSGNSVVPPGLDSIIALFPALKRRAIGERPSGAALLNMLPQSRSNKPVLPRYLKPFMISLGLRGPFGKSGHALKGWSSTLAHAFSIFLQPAGEKYENF